jgi:hypothetical protein
MKIKKIYICWDITPCNISPIFWVKAKQRFNFFLLMDPEDGGDIFLRIVSCPSPVCIPGDITLPKHPCEGLRFTQNKVFLPPFCTVALFFVQIYACTPESGLYKRSSLSIRLEPFADLTASLKCHGTPDTDIALEVPPA